jgi:DNA-binding MarR family transcriptional regulator
MVSHALSRAGVAGAKGAAAAPASDDVRDVLNSFRRIVRSLRVSSRLSEQQVGLSGAQLFVLQCIARGAPCSITELAERTATDQSSVSVVVGRLANGGYVKRSTSKLDRRSVSLTLTPKGKKRLESAPEAAQDRLIHGLRRLETDDLHSLSRILSMVVEAAEVSDESPTLFFEEPARRKKPPGSTHE